jgi:GT2 family glycosyltransferase
MNVSIVIVAFHCDDMLIQTVNSIAYSINSSCEVIIVNNGNRPSPEQVSDGVPGIKIITTGENILGQDMLRESISCC